MSNSKFAFLFLSPYIFMVLCLIIADSLSPALYRGIASERELEVAEFPFRFEVPDLPGTFIPEHLRSPIKIARKGFPEIDLVRVAPPPQAIPRITLIMVSEDLRLAIINDLVLKEGDAFGNGKILRIKQDGVVLSEGGRLKEIPVPQR